VLVESEARAARLVEDTRRLVEADERPAVDLVPVRASLASRRAARIAGEEALDEAKRALLLEMGSPPEALATLPPPATPFPADAAVDPAVAPAPGEAAARARAGRADVAAAALRREGAAALLRGARRELRPRLDLDLGLGYRGLESGGAPGRLVTPFYSSLGGPQASVGVTWAFPLRNRAAEGAAIVSEAAYRQAEVLADEAARAAALDAATAALSLRRSAEEVRVAAEAVRLHAAAVEGERQKFRLGTSTLFDVLFAEESLSAAELAEVEARRRHAQALARLRYETGALSGVEGAEAGDAAALAGRAPATPR
jgi:outer membrane protein TolC